MSTRYKAWLLGGGAVLLALATPIPAGAQSLEDALIAAYSTNPQLLAQRASLRATDEGVPRALSNWRPTVTLTGNAGKAWDDLRNYNTVSGVTSSAATFNQTQNISQRRTPVSAQLQVVQPIYRGGRTVAEIQRAENLVQRGRAQLAGVEQNVLLDAATAHMNVVRDQAILDLTISNERVLTRQLAAARDRFQVGEITRTDVAQSEARLSRATADRIQAEGNLIASRANYQRVVGDLPGRLRGATVPANLPTTEGDAVGMAGDNPTVIAARFNEAAARADVNLIEGEKLPTVSIQGDLLRNEQSASPNQARDTADILAVVSIPIYQQGSVDARAREAKQTAGQRRNEIDDALRRAREDAIRGLQSVNTARARIKAFADQVRANEIALNGVEQEARVGSRTTLDILDAQQELLNSQVNLVTSQRDEVVFGYQLAVAVGRLSAVYLKLPVEVYDPVDNYSRTRQRWIGTSIHEPKGKPPAK